MSARSLARVADVRKQRVLATVDSIPPGRVASYGQVALEALLPGRARLVGRLLSELPSHSELAWHRVLNAAGRSSFPRGTRSAREQIRRLRREGVEIDSTGRVDLRRFLWQP